MLVSLKGTISVFLRRQIKIRIGQKLVCTLTMPIWTTEHMLL